MARPMVLMQEDTLNELAYKYAQGVPVLAVIRQFNLEGKITAPTLTKLLSYMTAMQAESASTEVAAIIYDSLFPKWLSDNEQNLIMSNPPEWYYTGKMPLGKWVLRGTELPKAVIKAQEEKKKQVPLKAKVKGKTNGKAK